MPRVLIIAFGNPLRSDDGLAWRVAEELTNLGLPADIEIITRHQLTPELALEASQAEMVLFVDAAQSGVPGDIAQSPVKAESFSAAFSHQCSPAAILGMAQEIYGSSPQAFTISLCGECFDHGETLSAKVEESLPRLITLIRDLAAASLAKI
jgi:hydrogenase maturation protease